MRPNIAVAFAVGLGSTVPSPCGVGAVAAELAKTQFVKVTASAGSVELAFEGLSLASADQSVDGMEIALHFSQPLKETIAREITTAAAATIADASAGYDTLLIRAQSRSRFELKALHQGFVLHVTPTATPDDSSRLALVEIRRRTLLDETESARDLLAQLRRSQPDDQEFQRAEADIDLADRDNRSAAAKYRALLTDNPSDESLRDSLSHAQAGFAPQIESGADYQSIDKADRQWRGHIAGRLPVGEALELRGRIDFVDLDDNLVQFQDASTGPFEGSRTRADLSLDYEFTTRWDAMASLYGASNTIGAGAELGYEDAASSVRLQVKWHQPSWDYPESIVGNGTTDVASVTIARSFANSWFFNLGLGLHRYSFDDESSSATSSTLEAGLRWKLPLESNTDLSLGYNFDAEYADRVSLRPDGLGGFYAMLPLRDRVVHSADLRIASQFGAHVSTSAYAGYAKDLNDQGGLIAGAEIAYEPVSTLRIALEGNYSDVGDRAGDSGAFIHAALTITKAFSAPSGDTGGN